MLKIALTGGIGTGKTYISRLFLSMGIPVYCADTEAKKLYSQPEVKQKVKNLLCEEVFTGEEIDLKKMALAVFSDVDKLQCINSLIHPLIMQDFERWASESNGNIVIMESAVIFENQLESFFDMVMVVDAPDAIRKERLKKRDGFLTEEMILQRIYSQIPQKEKLKKADLIIDNSVENRREIVYCY